MAGNPPDGDRNTEALVNELVERLLEKYTARRRNNPNVAPLTAEQFLQDNVPDSVLIRAVSPLEKRRNLISELLAALNIKHKGIRLGKRVKRQGG
ncbi:hypothetical protein ACLB2K_051402 [Fragaria x ananassa]